MAVSGRQIGEQDVTTVVQTWSIAVAFVVAALVGLLSGSYPAYRAGALGPNRGPQNGVAPILSNHEDKADTRQERPIRTGLLAGSATAVVATLVSLPLHSPTDTLFNSATVTLGALAAALAAGVI